MPLHRNLTSPPSSWPGRELRKYHWPCTLSSPGREQSALCRRFYRSPGSLRGPGAPACVASAFGRHTGMYLMNVYSIFKLLPGRAGGGSLTVPHFTKDILEPIERVSHKNLLKFFSDAVLDTLHCRKCKFFLSCIRS